MKVLFVYSVSESQSFLKPLLAFDKIQFGISYISAVLKSHGHQTRCCVLSRSFEKRSEAVLLEKIRSFDPELVCFTAVQSEYPFIAKMATCVKRMNERIYTIVGGPYATLNQNEAIRGGFDALCVGEGRSPSGIANLWIRHNEGVEKNQPRGFLQDLDALPFLDRAMWQEFVPEEAGALRSVLLGRGCSFECTYCCNHALKRITS